VIRAHEHEHVVRATRAPAPCLPPCRCCAGSTRSCTWAHAMRLDQELACDAAVLRRRPRDRALYARRC
jgi:hypothetical protein